MKDSGANYIKPARDTFSLSSKVSPAGSKNKLEDILNDLMDLQGFAPVSETEKEKEKKLGSAIFSSPLPERSLPSDIRIGMNLPSAPLGIYHTLKTFQQHNRHKPYLTLANGRVVYVEYDVEMERIRLFCGNEAELKIVTRGVKESFGKIPVNELYEFKLESRVSEAFGFKRSEQTVQEKHRTACEILSSEEAAIGNSVPVLCFTIFNQKGIGISAASIKAEQR